MKKLVTIVSAVMMLLMLAACAPNTSLTAEDITALENGETAINMLITYALTDEDAENFAYSMTADKDVTVDGGKINKGSTASVTATQTAVKNTVGITTGYTYTYDVSVNGTVVIDGATDADDVTVEIEYSFNTADGSYGPLVINGKAYKPTDLLAATGFLGSVDDGTKFPSTVPPAVDGE